MQAQPTLDQVKPVAMLPGRVGAYRIELLAEWMGYAKGTKMTTNEHNAQTLVSRGAARFIDVDKSTTQPNDKAPDQPPKDKMMRRRKIKTA